MKDLNTLARLLCGFALLGAVACGSDSESFDAEPTATQLLEAVESGESVEGVTRITNASLQSTEAGFVVRGMDADGSVELEVEELTTLDATGELVEPDGDSIDKGRIIICACTPRVCVCVVR